MKITLSSPGFSSNGRTITCLKSLGTTDSNSDLFVIKGMDGKPISMLCFNKCAGIGSNSQDLCAEFIRSFRISHVVVIPLLPIKYVLCSEYDSLTLAIL